MFLFSVVPHLSVGAILAETGVDGTILTAIGGLITALGGAVVWGWKNAEKRAEHLQAVVIEKVFPTLTDITTANTQLTNTVKELINVLREEQRAAPRQPRSRQ